jgi:dihydroflavonol-4-reductase
MKALITGSTGMLGHNLAVELLAQGWEVKALVRSKQKAQKLFGNLKLEVIEGDMENVSGFAPALAGVDAVFHTAAYFREYFTPGDHWATLKRINIEATLELLEAAEQAGVATFIHTSSSGVVGASHGVGNESTPPDAEVLKNLYFRSKVEGDAAIAKWLETTRRLKVVSILPGWMFAPRDAAPTNAGKLVLDVIHGKIPGVMAAGASIADARDVAKAMIAAVQKGRHGEKYLVAGRLGTFAQIFAAIELASGIKAPGFQMPNWLVLGMAWLDTNVSSLRKTAPTMPLDGIRTMLAQHEISSKKAEQELGATFRPLLETITDTVQWYKDHGYVTLPT